MGGKYLTVEKTARKIRKERGQGTYGNVKGETVNKRLAGW